jgi:hypothetical protein
MVDHIEAGLKTLIEGPSAQLTGKATENWAMTIAQGLLEAYLFRKELSGMHVALSEHWLKEAETIDYEYVEVWGYGHLEVYIAVEECARSFEEAVEREYRKVDELPGIAAYEIDFDATHPKEFRHNDPIKWYNELSSLAPKIVQDWIRTVNTRMGKI